MKEIKKVLRALETADMHVHELEVDSKIPHHIYDTHYIMKGNDIVHVGNLTTIESFALRLNT